MHDAHARQIAQVHRLPGHGEGAGYDRLRSDDRGRGGKQDQRDAGPARPQVEERIDDAVGVRQQQRSLSEVVEHQGRQHQQVPGQPDRQPAEMAHVGIQRLRPGHGQNDRAQGQEGGHAVLDHEGGGIMGTERPQDFRVLDDVQDAEHGQGAEPQQHDRTEENPDPCRPMALDHEQRDQDRDGQRHHGGMKLRRRHLQPFNGGQHGNGRRYHAVAVEQGGGEDAEHADQRRDARLAVGHPVEQRQQSQTAALPPVVGPHDDDDVFDRNDDGDGPEDQRQHAQDMQPVQFQGMRAGERLLHCIERAGADIAEDHPYSAKDERRHGRLFRVGSRLWVRGGIHHLVSATHALHPLRHSSTAPLKHAGGCKVSQAIFCPHAAKSERDWKRKSVREGLWRDELEAGRIGTRTGNDRDP